MKNKLMIVLLVVPPINIYADWFHTFASYDCLSDKDHLIVNYDGAYNEKGEALSNGARKINPWSLVEADKSGERIISMKTVKYECQLSDGIYKIEIGPSPGNMNVQGRCGAAMSAWVSIFKEDKLLYNATFENDCHITDGDVLTEVIWRPGSTSPELIVVPYNKFYQ